MKNLIISKNYLFISLLFLFVVSVQCAKEEDSKGNSTTTVVPLAPSNLTGTIVNNQVILTWTDNSTNETGFKIERMTGTGSWSVKGSIATDILTYTDTGVAEGATYTYRVYSFNAAGNSSGYSNSNQITIPNAVTLPVVTTTTVTAIEITTAASGGSVSSDGGASVTARGVVWSTNATPTIALSTKTTDGSGTGGYSSAITGLTSNTTYHIRAYATNSSGTAYGNERTFKTINAATLPIISYTTTVTAIEITTAASGGSVDSDGGVPVTARGVVWSTNATPTIALSTKTTDGSGTGGYSSAITGLTANTTYHIRAYATNSSGTTYGNERTFKTYIVTVPVTDYDGNTYQTVTICNQVWTQTNLNVSHYRNGDVIPQVTDQTEWANLTTGAWCYYLNSTVKGDIYGKLYNWYAVNDSRGLAPTGWHVPTDAEWNTLLVTDCLVGNGSGSKGDQLKEAGTEHWDYDYVSPENATNSSHFTALPGGYRENIGNFNYIGGNGFWWSSSENATTHAWYRTLGYSNHNVDREYKQKQFGFSVRCLKD